jgi:hypothetical protein
MPLADARCSSNLPNLRSWMTTRDGSAFIICATASHHFSSGSEPIQRLCKRTLLRHSDVKLTLQFYTHAVSRDRMVAAGKC